MRFEKVSYEAFQKEMRKRGWTDEIIKPAYDNIQIPKRQTSKSAGYDFVTPVPFVLHPRHSIVIPTGIKAYFEESESMRWHLNLYIRSSLGIKQQIIMSNGTGIIDADYYGNPDNEGCILMAMTNTGDHYRRFEAGDRIMQGVFEQHAIAEEDRVQESRKGGVGSTDGR